MVKMATILVGRRFLLPQRLSRDLPKISCIRILSSDSSENEQQAKISLSSLRKTLERSTQQDTEQEKKTDPLIDPYKYDLAGIVKSNLKTRKFKQERKAFMKRESEVYGVTTSVILSDLRKSVRDKSVGNTERGKEELRRSIIGATGSSKKRSPPRKGPRWVRKSLEDFEKAQLDQAVARRQTTDPKLNQKIKDILSRFKVGPQHARATRGVDAAVEHWGVSIKSQKAKIDEEYYQQTKQDVFETPSWVSLSDHEGEKSGLFDSFISKAKLGQANTTHHAGFLTHHHFLKKLSPESTEHRNAFVKQMMLSNRLWKYPIDNEVCKVEEENTSFEEHVFLEYLLDEFPSKGPVRRFMELVINGLQKNPYLSVAQKKERVGWFREYFANFSQEELNF